MELYCKLAENYNKLIKMTSGSSLPQVVDSHLHLWELERFKYEWPRPTKENIIYRDFTPSDYQDEMANTPITGAVFIEVNETLEELEWVLGLTQNYSFIKGVVGYTDMTSPTFEEQIIRLKNNSKFVGLRKIWGDPDWIQRDDVIMGMEVLERHNLTFDLLIKTREQYEAAKQFLKRVPKNLKVVLDHLGKPNAVTGAEQWWFDDIIIMASYPNVHCKLSGMVTEGNLTSWKQSDFAPYVKHVLDTFGVDRVMFGSDWPVCKMAHADLPTVYQLLNNLLSELSENEKRKVFYENAVKFYNLDMD
uniref:uncharacterized protein LOC104266424 isoform X2 n=1 Tax=Ciona intestinalis TaxID=7719 RepID=UPI000EF4A60D|nr:uncharacterized protein LOC104266424 isoform X2 [Ciona intestinalis]|eukprot:XP_026693401.1 uncharacterized protein LOC104266424 isoform X2 [Ciona intestinalis]